MRLLIDERILAGGEHARVWASVADGRVLLEDDAGALGALPVLALDRVMVRFGRALDPEIALADEALACGGGRVLRRLRFHARVDTEARDYLVWERPGEEPIAAISTTVAAALRHLVASGI